MSTASQNHSLEESGQQHQQQQEYYDQHRRGPMDETDINMSYSEEAEEENDENEKWEENQESSGLGYSLPMRRVSSDPLHVHVLGGGFEPVDSGIATDQEDQELFLENRVDVDVDVDVDDLSDIPFDAPSPIVNPINPFSTPPFNPLSPSSLNNPPSLTSLPATAFSNIPLAPLHVLPPEFNLLSPISLPANPPRDFLDKDPMDLSTLASPIAVRRVKSIPVSYDTTQRPPRPSPPRNTAYITTPDNRTMSSPSTKGKARFLNRYSNTKLGSSPRSPISDSFSLKNTYFFRRTNSLPVTAREVKKRRPRRNSDADSERSSPSFIPEEDMPPLAEQYLTAPALNHAPTTRKKRSLFRGNTSSNNNNNQDLQGMELIISNTYSSSEEGFKENTTKNTPKPVTSSHGRVPVAEAERDELHPIMQSNSTSTRSIDEASLVQRKNLHYILYLSAFAMYGSIIRMYLYRLFGYDCEFPGVNQDFLTPLSERICVTASGRTIQTGGALFLDLPANAMGSFLMGIMTSLSDDWPPLPWLRADHPLQRHDPLHVAIKTGLCGSLSTFASWNTQMIVMLDGTHTSLGSQIVPALSGYMVGVYCAIASFLFGRHVSIWLNRWKNGDKVIRSQEQQQQQQLQQQDNSHNAVAANELEEGHAEQRSAMKRKSSRVGNVPLPLPRIFIFPDTEKCILNGKTIPFALLACLMMLFFIADFSIDISFYRQLWLSTFFAPAGALLRWTLAKWNNRLFNHRLSWVPWGTVAANVIGSILSALFLALEMRISAGTNGKWVVVLLQAMRYGFAGSLSTVSTFVKEMVDITSNYPEHAKAYHYAIGTISVCAFLSMLVYSPIVRYS